MQWRIKKGAKGLPLYNLLSNAEAVEIRMVEEEMKHFEMDLKFRQEQMCFANEQQEKDRQERMVQFSAEMEVKKRELDLKVEEIAMMCSQTDAQLQALQMQS